MTDPTFRLEDLQRHYHNLNPDAKLIWRLRARRNN